VRRGARFPGLLASGVGLALVAVGVVYLTVECQALPGFLGPTNGDTAPRSGLGIAFVLLGLMALVGGLVAVQRRSNA